VAKVLSHPRALGALIAMSVVDEGRSLDRALPQWLSRSSLSPKDSAWVRELTYGILRRLLQLEAAASLLLEKPLKNKDRDLHYLLLVGIYQLRFMRTPEHAALSETVEACLALKKPWAKRLINGCLRNFLRSEVVIDDKSHHHSHPQWLADQIGRAWPEQVEKILAVNNLPPPMCLRVNLIRDSREKYLDTLDEADIVASPDQIAITGVILGKGMSTDSLPGFQQGYCSVQDTAAQLAVTVLDPGPGDRVLDACAAPGGKSGHILEHTHGNVRLTAIDSEEHRMRLVKENLARLELDATCLTADASDTQSWWDGKLFDRILLDAPCSGTGVIRRHPDIRHHRRSGDIESLTKIQSSLLAAVWPTLRPGGRLLYCTCSILPEENSLQVRTFLDQHDDAKTLPERIPGSIQCDPGSQMLPGIHNCDGFYYCLIEKSELPA
jgi:16S rRNA (cytosine967-C5)-methyltransferase